MSESIYDSNIGYHPAEPIELPPLYFWPPKPLKILHWMFKGLLFLWVFFYHDVFFVMVLPYSGHEKNVSL